VFGWGILSGMDKKSTVIIVLVTVFAVIGIFTVSLQTSTIDTETLSSDSTSTSEWLNMKAEKQSTLEVSAKTVVTAKHAFRNGEHIVAGEIPLPTPCHILDADSSVSSDKKTIYLSLNSSIKTAEVCTQVITPARFKVVARGDSSAQIAATLNSQPVTLNLIEADPSEDLDNFELYIKG
jgi:hypothetical protein